MVLQLEDSTVDWVDNFNLKNFLKQPDVKKYGDLLKQKEQVTISNNHNLIYVSQREMAAVIHTDPYVHLLGSDDATTCHFVILRCNVAPGVSILGHLDGVGTENFFSQAISCIRGICRLTPGKTVHVTAHLIGGFRDLRATSEGLSTEILEYMNQMENVHFHLKTALITHANDTVRDGAHFPVLYGIGYNIKDDSLFPAKFTSESRNPERVLRGTRFFCHDEVVCNVYDTNECQLVFHPFDYHADGQNFAKLSRMPDEVLSQYSTSPDQEPEGFVDHIRASFKLISEHPKPLRTIFKNGSLKYKPSQSRGWKRVK